METAELLERFLGLWVVVDPLGTLPVFIAVSAGLTAAASRRLAVEATLAAFGFLALFAVAGAPALSALGVSLEAFRIAGGIVLFLFALRLIFGEPKHQSDLASVSSLAQTAVFPLAIPSLASPGAMLAATLTSFGAGGEGLGPLLTLALLAAVMLTALALLLAASPIHRVIGDAGAGAISRIMGVVLAAVAVEEVLGAFVSLGALPAIA